MKFTCSRELLDKQLQHVSRIVTVRPSLPVLSNLLLETNEKILRISGTDLEITITTFLPAKIKEEGTFTIPARIFQEFVHQNPDEEIDFTLESFELVCKSKKVAARIAGIDPEEYPALPKLTKGKKFQLPLQLVVEAMKQVVIAVAADQSRPVLTGVYVQLQSEQVVLAATDSFRLAERALPIVPVQEIVNLLLPSRTTQEIIRIGAVTEAKDLELEVTEQQVRCRIGDVDIYSPLISGSFPQYQTIIPSKFEVIAEVTTAEFIQALRLSYIFSTSGVANVLIEVNKEGVLSMASYGSQRGSTQHLIYALIQGKPKPLRAAFNAKFLLDAAQAAATPHLTLKFSGQTSPLVITTEDPHYLQLVMPIRLES